MKTVYKNRKNLFGKLYKIRTDLRNIIENNSELLKGAETTMLQTVENKLQSITVGQNRRKQNK